MTEFVQDPVITSLKKQHLTCRWLQDYKPKKPSLLKKITERSPKLLTCKPEIIVAISWSKTPTFKQQFTVALAELKLNFRTTFYIECITGFKAINPLEIRANLNTLLQDTFPFYTFGNTPGRNHPPIRYLVNSGQHLLKEVIPQSESFASNSIANLEYLQNDNITFRNSQDLDLLKTMQLRETLSGLLEASRNCLSEIGGYFKASHLNDLFQKILPKEELIDLTPQYSDLGLLKAVICIDRNLTELTTITCLVSEADETFRLLKPLQWLESKPKSFLVGTYLPIIVKELESTYKESLNLDHESDVDARFKSQEILILTTDRTLVNEEPKIQFIDVRDEAFLFNHWIAIAKGILSESKLLKTDYLDGNQLTFNQINIPNKNDKEDPTLKLDLRRELFDVTAPDSPNPAVLGLLVCLAGLHQ